MHDDSRRGSPARSSELPVDLAKERETFVRSFLKKGFEITEDLLRENAELRRENQHLQQNNARLRAQVASDDAIRDLIKTIDALEIEKKSLLERSRHLEQTQQTDQDRVVEIEGELNDLANLYVASFQLHASLSPRRVVRHIMDMLGQLVGADGFVIYLLEADGRTLRPIAWERLAEQPKSVAVGEGRVGQACVTCAPYVSDNLTGGTLDEPTAVIPFVVQDRPVGAVAITAVLAQKEGWQSVDWELFKLIGSHAGTAMIAANLYSDLPGPVPALTGFLENLRRRDTTGSRPVSGE